MRDTLTPLLSNRAAATSRRLRSTLSVAVFVALTIVSLVAPPTAVGDGTAANDWPWEVRPGADSDKFPLVGELTFRNEHGEPTAADPVAIDPDLHLAVFLLPHENQLRFVDTRSLEQLDSIALPEGFDDVTNLYGRAVLDREHHRLFLPASKVGDVPGERDLVGAVPGDQSHGCFEGTLAYVICQFNAGAEVEPAIVTVSLTGAYPPIATRLQIDAPEESQQPTSVATKLAYHEATNRVYLVTEAGRNNPAGGAADVANPHTTLHEFRAEDLTVVDDTGAAEPVWSYPLDTCERVASRQGGFLARSSRGDFIYLACEARTSVQLGDDQVSPAMHGALRVDLNLDPSDPSDTSRFEERFHPFAANLTNGGVTGDATKDLLLFVGNSAGTNRLFTFDAYQEAWTGSSALPETGNVMRPTVNEETGRIYAVTGGDTRDYAAIRVTEGDRIAVPNGVDYDVGLTGGTHLSFDPSTRRLFVPRASMCLEWTEEWRTGSWRADANESRCAMPEDASPHVRVFEDRLADAPRPEPVDYDQYTEDLSGHDGPIFSSAGAHAGAFGARYLYVGGTQTARPSAYGPAWGDLARSAPAGPGARDIVRAEVDETTLSRVTNTPSVVASATGLTLGEQTASDLKSNTERDWPEDFPEEMRGREAHCDDFGGEPTDDVKPGAAVSCDSTDPVGSAGAFYTATDEDAPVQVGYAEASVEVREDEDLGAVATVTAVARDVDIFGQISIGEIRSEAIAIAHGAPGTAATELVREYRQVRIGDSFACGWGADDQCDAWEIARAINEAMQPRLIAYVPAQDTTLNPTASDEPDDDPGKARVSNATPGGARAGVTLDPYDAQSNLTINQDQRTELPGLQIVYYDDHQSVSRHIFQFAAVELDTFFYISSAPEWDPPDWANEDGGSDGATDTDSGGDIGADLPRDLGGAAARKVAPPPVFALGEEPSTPPEVPTANADGDGGTTDDAGGEAPSFESEFGASGPQQGQPPGLGTADGPTLSTGGGVPAPEVAPDATAGEQGAVAQGEQSGSSAPGGLMLTRQRMGETVPLAVVWALATLPFYLAVRRRRLLASSVR